MTEWSFWDYIDERGINLIQEWLMDRREVPVKARAKIQRILLQLAGTALWTRPLTSNLDDYDDIVEIRVLWMNVQYSDSGDQVYGNLLFCSPPKSRVVNSFL